MENYAILSDIHGNLQALQAVHNDMKQLEISGLILLGDLVDYGMQSNEVISYLRQEMVYPIICNLWGNHERAILLGDYSRFSSQRGVESAQYTASILTGQSKDYLDAALDHKGMTEFFIHRKKCLAVHGSANDPYWRSICPDELSGDYSEYDIVFSGHSHCSHAFTKFYDADDPAMRNKHAVLFVNPGSVGQPRNHHPEAQYALLKLPEQSVYLRSVPYDIKAAQAYYHGKRDDFYRSRLSYGI